MKERVTFRVRYAETDQMGRAYHAWYLVWLEMGRTSFMRRLGLPYGEMEKRGFYLPVRSVEVRYHRPLHYDEEVTVETWLARVGRARLVFGSLVLAEDGRRAAEGTVELAVCDADGKPRRLPADLHDLLKRCEHAG